MNKKYNETNFLKEKITPYKSIKIMDFIIRREEEKDFRAVEEMTREAFWNLYIPGAHEHFLAHKIRNSPDFIPELDLVAVKEGKIVGNIMYTHSYIVDDKDKKHIMLTFGPLTVMPNNHRQGIGRALVEKSIYIAKEMGYKAVLIFGFPGIYSKLGFKNAKEFSISTPDGRFPEAFQIRELYPEALKGIKGKYYDSEDFQMKPEEVEEFDKTFPLKEKLVTASQKDFEEISKSFL